MSFIVASYIYEGQLSAGNESPRVSPSSVKAIFKGIALGLASALGLPVSALEDRTLNLKGIYLCDW